MPRRLPFLTLVCAQCSVSELESRIAVLTPAMSLGSSVPSAGQGCSLHDPDEEVGREEGPEDHDLRDDEEQHPEHLGLDPRRPVGRRRAVVDVPVAGRVMPGGDGGGFHPRGSS
jgi:hypothetical protein